MEEWRKGRSKVGRDEGEKGRERGREGGKNFFYLMMHLTHFIYGYMALNIW